MCGNANPSEPKFWLHIPLQTTCGDWLKIPPGGRLSVLGYSARLYERDLPGFNSLTDTTMAVIRQWLLFDPLPEKAAVSLFEELRLRLPVLSLREQAALGIPDGELQRSAPEDRGMFNGPTPTLIPAEFSPRPTWVDARMTSYEDGANTLGPLLSACPAVKEERIRAAIELAIASRYDTLPRSIFLSQLTIIDSLAIHSDRSTNIQNWLCEKIKEAHNFNDQGLVTGLENLKQGSHGSAVRELVGRAARAMGESDSRIMSRQKLVTKLYRVRSGLSHDVGATLTSENVEQARQLARFVTDAAIEHPTILAQFPLAQNRASDRKSHKIKKLWQILIAKVCQLLRNLL
jgi:hypothetical protein